MEKFTDKELEEMLKDSDDSSKAELDSDIFSDNSEFQFKEDDLEDSLENNIDLDFDTIPDKTGEIYEDLDPVIVDRAKITLGLTTDELVNLVNYVSGKGPKPDFIDRFNTDTLDRLNDMILIMSEVLLARIPVQMALLNQLDERLFHPTNLYDMDSKVLSATRLNITREMQGNLREATNAVQTIRNSGSTNSQYRNLLDRIMMLPEDKFNKIKDLVLSEDEK